MKRGQIATEFLMNYGWAILILILVLGSLSYMGVINIDKYFPSHCYIKGELSCEEYIIDEYFTTIRLRNIAGKDLIIKSVELKGKLEGINGLERGLENGEETIFRIKHKPLLEGEKFKTKMLIDYYSKESGITHTKKGNILAKVQRYIPEDGLISYWYFGEKNGTIIKDLVGNNTCECQGNCPSWNYDSVLGSTMIFSGDGHEGNLNCGNDSSINFGGLPFTILIRYKPENPSRAFSRGDGEHGWYLWADNRTTLYLDYNPFIIEKLSDNWNYFVTTKEGGNIKIYLEGELEGENESGELNLDNSEPLYIGGSPTSNFKGEIEEMKIYHRILSEKEIKEYKLK
jgi:hypothetical protein